MADARVQLRIEVETEGAEQLTSLRRELERLGEAGAASLEQIDASLTATLDHLRESRQLISAATNEFVQGHQRLFSTLDPLFQSFFNRLTSGARSFRDLWRRLLDEVLRLFLRALEQMLGSWFSALRQMGGGSFAGGTLGVLAPFAGLGGTPPFLGEGGGLNASNIGLFERLGIDLRGIGPIGGNVLASGGLLAALLGISRGSPVLGALGGAAAGFAFGGPIGTLIGGGLGFLGGLFSRGHTRRRAAEAETAFFQQILALKKEYDQFRLAYEAALDAIDSLWVEFQAVMPEKYGKYGRRAVRNVAPHVAEVRRQMEETEKIRRQRSALLGALPIPEFAAGGLVDAALSQILSGQGKMLAWLHRGEAVLNARAVRALGPGFIEQANRAPGFQSGGLVASAALGSARAEGITVNITVIPSLGMDERALASEVARALERRLNNLGHSLRR
jgi:hypothetical protein